MTIISHEHKFIYLRTRKTASSTVEKLLVPYLNRTTDVWEGATYAHESPEFEKGFNARNPRNKHKNWSGVIEEYELTQEQWNSYYKFTTERNPWDKLVSMYYMGYSSFGPRVHDAEWRPEECNEFVMMPTLREAVGHTLMNRMIDIYSNASNLHIYMQKGANKLAVDKIYKYEELPEMFEDLNRRFGFSITREQVEKTRLKSFFRPKKYHYSEFFSEQAKKDVEFLFKTEIDLLGYEFEDRRTSYRDPVEVLNHNNKLEYPIL